MIVLSDKTITLFAWWMWCVNADTSPKVSDVTIYTIWKQYVQDCINDEVSADAAADAAYVTTTKQ